MTVWTETEDNKKYGVVIYNFWEEGDHHLRLNVGDSVHILRQHDDWYYGYNTKARHQKGIFPQNYVHHKEHIVSKTGNQETVLANEAPLVQEITSILLEWGSIWKNLYIGSNRTELSDFEKIWKKMRELIDWRRIIMSRKLTMDEMKYLQQKVTNKIDMGNAILGLDLVVRDEQGNILDPAHTSTISLFKQAQQTYVTLWKQGFRTFKHDHLIKHQIATQRIQDEKDGLSDRPGPKKSTSFNLYINVKNFVCRIGENADVLLTLYDAKQGEFISEHYIIKWGNQGMPRDIEMFNNLRVLFTDLGQKDMHRERISIVCQIIRIGGGYLLSGRMDLRDADNKKQTHCLRRPFGVAAFDITAIVKGNLEPDDDKQFFVPFMICGDRDSLDGLLKKAVTAKEINHKGQGLWITIKKIQGDLKQMQKEYPHLLSGSTAIARKMGFPDVIMPGDVRNDIYVTLVQGEYKRGNKTSDKNIEVTMCVCNANGDVLEDVISEGAGGSMGKSYKSVIYYHEDKPKWVETVKLAIPIDEFYGSHLKFTFKHRSSTDTKDKQEKPFAMSFVKLMQDNGVTIRDCHHDLLVYKLEPKRQEVASSYLKLPSTRQDLEAKGQPQMPLNKFQISTGALTLNTNDSFQIGTLVCSTKLTHNVDLMGLLKWRDNPAGLKDHLLSFMQVDGEEVVKFLQDVLDALFNILMQNSDSDLYDNLVFDALIFIIMLTSHQKYHQFRPVLDVYIKENFSATLAYNKLLVVLRYYVEYVNNEQKRQSLLDAVKSLEYIFKFIIRSRVLFSALNEGRGKQQFEISLKQVFNAINNMMREGEGMKAFATQEAALKFLPTTIPDVITVFEPGEFSLLLVEFINSVPSGRLTRQKLGCMSSIVHSALFRRQDCRNIMLPVMLNHIGILLDPDTQSEEKDLCIKILSDVLELLYMEEPLSTRDDISTIALSTLRTVIQAVIAMDRHSPLIGHFVAVMTAILRQMTPSHYNLYINHFPTRIDLTDFLMEILMVFRDLVNNNVFPLDWNEMIMLQNSVFLEALRCFANTLKERFTNPFEYQVWNNFFHCAISFLTQGPLQLEDFSSAKRLKIIAKYKDMRRETGFEIRCMWFNLGQHKISFIPEMVGPILEMTLIPETELRKATIPIFFDMMQCEFTTAPSVGNSKLYRNNFNEFKHEMITQLDALVEGGRGDEHYKDLFYAIMSGLCESHSTMKTEGLEFVNVIKELLQRLLEYRDVINEENKENKMSCTVNLLNFYRDIQRQEMYIRYLHKLCDLHLECDNYTEAAYTLMLYANLLNWSEEPLPTILTSNKYPEAETHRELKEALYNTMIEYFDKGRMWEKGIDMSKELVQQYETEIFDYIQLGKILKQQAEFYDRIMRQMRPEPEYFRVGYYGHGFPVFIQNKVFIYRGKEYERLPDFQARLLNQFPNAQLLKSLANPSEEIKQSPNQYMLINAVHPVMEPKAKFTSKKVHDQILKYYKVNEVQKFTFSKRTDEGKNDDVTKMWLEKTTLVTAYPLPGILRWFPVTATHIVQVSPLENAIETMESSNQKLKSLIDAHKLDPNLRVDPLGGVISGIVDAAVSGGISNYKVFYQEEYLQENATQRDKTYVRKLKQNTTTQMFMLQKALDIHGDKAHESLQPFHAHLLQRFKQMKQFVETEYGIKLGDEVGKGLSSAAVKRIQTMPPQTRSSEMVESITQPTHSPSKISPAVRVAQSMLVRTSMNNTAGRETSPTKATANKSSRESPTKVYQRTVSQSPRGSDVVDTREGSPSTASNNSMPKNTGSPKPPRSNSIVIELNEQLTPRRPLRPESNRRSKSFSEAFGRPLTIRHSNISINSNSSETSSSSGATAGPEEPPPLPEKQMFADYSNVNIEDPPYLPPRTNSLPRINTHKKKEESEPQVENNYFNDMPQHPLPPGENDIPIIPPKNTGGGGGLQLQLPLNSSDTNV